MIFKKLLLSTLFLLSISMVSGQEDCTNGLDDDLDGLIDLNDFVDCACMQSGSIGTVTSLIPNPSFETFGLCPSVPNQITEATGWEQMTNAGPDYFNTCDPFSAVAPAPFPDGNGIAGFAASNGFLEYIGAVLTTPLVTGQEYRMDFNIAASLLDGSIANVLGPPINANIQITLYGNTSTTDFPIPVNTGINFPPPSNWIELGSLNYNPSDLWTLESFTFVSPIDAQMIAFGPPSFPPLDYLTASNLPYFFVDNLVLNLENAFGTSLAQSGELCLGNSAIESTVPDPTTQWFFDGVAIPGQTTDDIDISAVGLGAGDYSLAIFPVTGCAFSTVTVTDNDYPDLSYTLSDLCPPGDVTFTSTSTIASGFIDSTIWDVGTVYETDVVIENFPNPGSQSITLSAISDIGCRVDSTFSISVEAPPVANFSFVPDCFNNPIQFTDLSLPGPNGSPIGGGSWDFDGLGTSVDQNPTFQFHPLSQSLQRHSQILKHV